jgi:hypothetical protein
MTWNKALVVRHPDISEQAEHPSPTLDGVFGRLHARDRQRSLGRMHRDCWREK